MISCSSLLVSFSLFVLRFWVSFVGFDIGFSRVFFHLSIFADCRQPVGNLSVTCRPTVGGGELFFTITHICNVGAASNSQR